MSVGSLLERLEAECAQGWPAPYWPQDAGRRVGLPPERCRNGHLYTVENTRWRGDKRPVRYECRCCHRLGDRGVLWSGRPMSGGLLAEIVGEQRSTFDDDNATGRGLRAAA